MLQLAGDDLFETKVTLMGQVGFQAPLRYSPAGGEVVTCTGI